MFLADRKLFAEGFLFGIATLCFIATGNCSRKVSCSTWHHCVSYQQETICERFPIRLDAIVFLTGRKLFAKGFLCGMAPLCFLPAGNFFAGRFLDSARNDMGDMATLCFLSTGNYSRKVSYLTWHYFVSCRQETIRERFPIRLGTTVFLADRKLFTGRFLDSASDPRNDRGAWQQWNFLRRSAVSRQRIADKADHKKAGPHGSAFCYSLFFRCLIPLSAMSWRYCTPCQWILETPL